MLSAGDYVCLATNEDCRIENARKARIEAGMCRWLSTASKSNICLDPVHRVSMNLNTVTKLPSVSLTCCRTNSNWIQLTLFLLCLHYTMLPLSTSALIFESKPIHFGSSLRKSLDLSLSFKLFSGCWTPTKTATIQDCGYVKR